MTDELHEATKNHDSAKFASDHKSSADKQSAEHNASPAQKEIGGRDGPDPTRYGDWEKAGRCIDF